MSDRDVEEDAYIARQRSVVISKSAHLFSAHVHGWKMEAQLVFIHSSRVRMSGEIVRMVGGCSWLSTV